MKRWNSEYGNTRYTRQILKLDEKYLESILFYFPKVQHKSKKVLTNYYLLAEVYCPLCCSNYSEEKKTWKRSAAFTPTEAGYIYTCTKCHQTKKLNEFLRSEYPAVADDYCKDRWIEKLAGKGFNCPEPPHNIRKEYYADQARKMKEKNMEAYYRKQRSQSDQTE